MWKVLLLIIITSAFSYSPSVLSANVSLSICEYVAVDDKRRLRSFLKSNRLKIRKIFQDLKCNDKNILIFAASRNSLNTAEMIIGKLPKNVISDNLIKLSSYSDEIVTIAKKRIE